MRQLRIAPLFLFAMVATSPAFGGDTKLKVGERVDRRGDEIVVCGQLFHTTAPVKLWTDPGGYDAYRTERRFAPLEDSSFEKSKNNDIKNPSRFGMRQVAL